MRALATLFALALSLLASGAEAQAWDRAYRADAVDDEVPLPPSQTSVGYGAPVVVVADPIEPPPRVHRDRSLAMVIGGAAMLVVGYGASAVWAGYYFDSLPLGPQGCNDQYAGWHLLPVIGPVIGMFAGGGCIPDGLHVEEAVLPVVFSLVQAAGLALTIVGAVLHEQRSHAPRVALAIDPSGGFASLAWSL